ncbi:MAG: ABC transporter ATP-binding protein/permease [Clostridia bacterium]|nr:ABC transporter ATP-binding protein/permease [Clostridia bacterium]
MKIQSKKFNLLDLVRIPFVVSPTSASIKIIDRIITAFIPSLQIVFTANFIDTAFSIFNNKRQFNDIYLPLFMLIGIIAYQNIDKVLINFIDIKLTAKLTEQYQSAIMQKRALLEYHHIENNDDWELIARVCNNPAERISRGLNILMHMINMIINISSYIIILTLQVWWAAVIVVSFSVPIFYISVKSGKANYDGFKKASIHQRRAGYMNDVLTERDYVEERSLFSYTDDIDEKWYDKFEIARKIVLKVQAKELLKMKGAGLITVLVSFLIAGVLIPPLNVGTISIGFFIALITAAFNLVQMTSWELSSVTNDLANQMEYLKDLSNFSFMSEQPGVLDIPDISVLKTITPTIEFKNVSFKYPCIDKYVLRNFSMKLNPKKQYAFVGKNGAGKTTITKLLTGLYGEYEGQILIGNKDIKTYTAAQLKAIFSIVYQDFAKYSISLFDNVRLGNIAGSNKERIGSALESIGLGYLTEKLLDGIQSPLGKIKENGVDLSGGEWQRIAMARTLVSDAPVRILDEPTAALDPIAESNIYQNFSQISTGQLTIFITHRLGAAKLADEILVIDDGMVAEQGTHDELMRKNGLYAEMFEKQRGWYI